MSLCFDTVLSCFLAYAINNSPYLTLIVADNFCGCLFSLINCTEYKLYQNCLPQEDTFPATRMVISSNLSRYVFSQRSRCLLRTYCNGWAHMQITILFHKFYKCNSHVGNLFFFQTNNFIVSCCFLSYHTFSFSSNTM